MKAYKIHSQWDCNHCQTVIWYVDVDAVVASKGDTPFSQWDCNHCQTVRQYAGDPHCITVNSLSRDLKI